MSTHKGLEVITHGGLRKDSTGKAIVNHFLKGKITHFT